MISIANPTQPTSDTSATIQYYDSNQIANYSYKNATANTVYYGDKTTEVYQSKIDFSTTANYSFDNATLANTSFGMSNTSFGMSNTSFGMSNTSFGMSNTSFGMSNTSFGMSNTSFGVSNTTFTEYAEIPYYIKATSMTFCIVIMCLGVIGNVMVPIVILKTKDMRNSTNIFLVNLSIADLMVLLVCTPTVLVEVNSKPETWVLGKELCLAVPFVELTVAHASVLTILAISFERYYAICEPLRAGYVCTKTRATLICALAWFFAALFTSPILAIAEHHTTVHHDGTTFTQCLTQAATIWQITFFVAIIILLYIFPLITLIILYTVIAKNLITAASKVVMNKTVDPYNTRARKQVILMLGTVVLCFFLCLMPYRILALWIIITPSELTEDMNPEKWYSILYFSRIMLYINSAINPILYNLMSSKFRVGFCKVCICYSNKGERKQKRRHRTAITNGSTTSSSLTRTTNSLKKLFNYGNSIDKSENDSDGKDKEANTAKANVFERLFTKNRKFVRQHSEPVCTNIKPKMNRMHSEGGTVDDITDDIKKQLRSENRTKVDNINDDIKIVELKSDGVRFIRYSDVRFDERVTDIEFDMSNRNPGSLRRSVLLNNVKAKSIDCETDKGSSRRKVKVECVVGLQKSKSVDCEFPESFV